MLHNMGITRTTMSRRCCARQFSGDNNGETNDDKILRSEQTTTDSMYLNSPNNLLKQNPSWDIITDKLEHRNTSYLYHITAQQRISRLSNTCSYIVTITGILLFTLLLVLDVLPTETAPALVYDGMDSNKLAEIEEFLHVAEESFGRASATLDTMHNNVRSQANQQRDHYFQGLFSILRSTCQNAIADIVNQQSTAERLDSTSNYGKAFRLSGSVVHEYTDVMLAVGYNVIYKPLNMMLHFIIVMIQWFAEVIFGFRPNGDLQMLSSPTHIMPFPFHSSSYMFSSSNINNDNKFIVTPSSTSTAITAPPILVNPSVPRQDRSLHHSNGGNRLGGGEWDNLINILSCMLSVANRVITSTGEDKSERIDAYLGLFGSCEHTDRYTPAHLIPAMYHRNRGNSTSSVMSSSNTNTTIYNTNNCDGSQICPALFSEPSHTTRHLMDTLLQLLQYTDEERLMSGETVTRSLENLEGTVHPDHIYGSIKKVNRVNSKYMGNDSQKIKEDMMEPIEVSIQDKRLLDEEISILVDEVIQVTRQREAQGDGKVSRHPSQSPDVLTPSRRLRPKLGQRKTIHNGEGILAVLPVRSGRKLPFHNIHHLVKMHADMKRGVRVSSTHPSRHTDDISSIYAAAETISHMSLSVVVSCLDNLDLHKAVKVLMNDFKEESINTNDNNMDNTSSTGFRSAGLRVHFDGRWRNHSNSTVVDDSFDLTVRPLRLKYPVHKPTTTTTTSSFTSTTPLTDTMKSQLSKVSSLVSYCIGDINAPSRPNSTITPLRIVQLSSKRHEVKIDSNRRPRAGTVDDHFIVRPATDSSELRGNYNSNNRQHNINIQRTKPRITILQSYALLVHLGILVGERSEGELRVASSIYTTQHHPNNNFGKGPNRPTTSFPILKYMYYIVIDESRVLHVPPITQLRPNDASDAQLISSLIYPSSPKKGSQRKVNVLLYNFMSVLLEPILSIKSDAKGLIGSFSFLNANGVKAFASQCTTLMSKSRTTAPHAHLPLRALKVHDQGFTVGQQAVPVLRHGTMIPVPVRRLYDEKAVSRGGLLIAESFRGDPESFEEDVYAASPIGNHMKSLARPSAGGTTANIDLLSPYCFAISRDAFKAADGFLGELTSVYRASVPFPTSSNVAPASSTESHDNNSTQFSQERGHIPKRVERYPFPSFGALAQDSLFLGTYQDDGLESNWTDNNIAPVQDTGNNKEKIHGENGCKAVYNAHVRNANPELVRASSIYKRILSKRSEEELGWHLSIRLFDAWKRATITDATHILTTGRMTGSSHSNNRYAHVNDLALPLWPIMATGARVVKLPSDISLPVSIKQQKIKETRDFLRSFVVNSLNGLLSSKDVTRPSSSRNLGVAYPSHGSSNMASSLLSISRRLLQTSKAAILSRIIDPVVNFNVYQKERNRLNAIVKLKHARSVKKGKPINPSGVLREDDINSSDEYTKLIAIPLEGDVLDYFDVSLKHLNTLVPLVKRSMKLSKRLLQRQGLTKEFERGIDYGNFLSLMPVIGDSNGSNKANDVTDKHTTNVNEIDWADLNNLIVYHSDQNIQNTISDHLMTSYFTQTYPHAGILLSQAVEQPQVLPILHTEVRDINTRCRHGTRDNKEVCPNKEGAHSSRYHNTSNNIYTKNIKTGKSVLGLGAYLSIEEKSFTELLYSDIRKARSQIELRGAFNTVVNRVMLAICKHIASMREMRRRIHLEDIFVDTDKNCTTKQNNNNEEKCLRLGRFIEKSDTNGELKRFIEELKWVYIEDQSNGSTWENSPLLNFLYISVPLSACVECGNTTARTIRVDVAGMYTQGWCPLSRSTNREPSSAPKSPLRPDDDVISEELHVRHRYSKRSNTNNHDLDELLELLNRDKEPGNDEELQFIRSIPVQKALLPPLVSLRELLKRATLVEDGSHPSSFEEFVHSYNRRGATVSSVVDGIDSELREASERANDGVHEDDKIYLHLVNGRLVRKPKPPVDGKQKVFSGRKAPSYTYTPSSFFVKGINNQDSFILYELLRSYNMEVLRHQIEEKQLKTFPSPFAKSIAIESLTSSLISVEFGSNYVWTSICQKCSGFAIEMVQFFIPLSQSTNFFQSCGGVTCFCPGYDRSIEGILSRSHVPSLFVHEFNFAGAAGAERLQRLNLSHNKGALAGDRRNSAGSRSTGANILILHMTPVETDDFIFHRRYKHRFDYFICRSMFEMSRVSQSWVKPANTLCDEVWVPALFVKRAFEDSGIDSDKLVIIHEGMDTNLYDPISIKPYDNLLGEDSDTNQWRKWCNRPLRTASINTNDGGNRGNRQGKAPYRFFSNFKWEPRKGWDALFEAYYMAFRTTAGNNTDHVALPPDEVTLLIIARMFPEDKYDPFDTSVMTGQIDEDARRKDLPDYKGIQDQSYPHFCIVTELLSEEEITRLYGSSDAFVLPTRGEGWGLPLQMAMSMGLPTISTNWGGNTEFMTKDNSFLVDIDREEELDPKTSPVHVEKGMKLAVPSVSHLMTHMKYVVSNIEEARKVGRRAREHIATHFNQKTVADSVRMRLAIVSQKLSSKTNFDLRRHVRYNAKEEEVLYKDDNHVNRNDICPISGAKVYAEVHGVPEMLGMHNIRLY